MNPLTVLIASCLVLVASWSAARGQDVASLPGTQPLTIQGDPSVQMVAGIDKFLLGEIERCAGERPKFWNRDFSSPEAYDKSVEQNRERLRKIIGAGEARLPVKTLELVGDTVSPTQSAETDLFTVQAVRWPVFDGVWGEGLWLRPKAAPLARLVVVPDADQTPEMITG